MICRPRLLVFEKAISYLRNSEERGFTIEKASELWILYLRFVKRKVTFVVQFMYVFLFIKDSLPVYIYVVSLSFTIANGIASQPVGTLSR
jgi:hypothetical protein